MQALMASTSVYQKLGTSDIRLLVLPPGSLESSIECHLKHTNLDAANTYDALSYVWGPTADPNHILVDGQPFTITQNLHFALRHLRHQVEPLIFWIDALCINQSDNTERSSQVRIMRKVYERARQVIGWLGMPSNNVHVINGLLEELDRNDDGELHAVSIMESAFDYTKLEKWKAVLELFGFEYWKRVWIVQEVVCARKMLLQCGTFSVSWTEIARLAYILDANREMINTVSELRGAGLVYITTIARLYVLQWGWENMHQGLPLLYLLQRTRRHRCSDPRDKVYGILGISEDTLNVDYDISPMCIFMETTKMIISKRKKLDVICESWSPRVLHEQPSWCPDWSQERLVASLTTITNLYSAAADSEANAAFSGDGKILSCTGCCIGGVTALGETYWEKDFYDAPLSEKKKQIMLTWLDLALNERPQDAKPDWEDDRIEAFWRTLIGGTAYPDEELNPNLYRHLFDVARGAEDIPHQESLEASNAKEAAYEKLCRRLNPSATDEDQFQRYIARFATKTNTLMVNRNFFTAGNAIIGIAPYSSVVEDRVCILQGCDWPVILRKEGVEHVLVGAAYVHGFMKGEAITKISEGLLEVENFFIR